MRRFLRRVGEGTGPQNLITPLQIPGLFLWLDATTNTGAPGSAITTWIDKSGNGRDAGQNVANNKPAVGLGSVFVPNSPTGKAGVGFDFSKPSWMAGTLPAGPAGIGTTTGQTYYLWLHESVFGIANQVAWQDQFGASPQLIVEDGAQKPAWRDNIGTHSAPGVLAAGFHTLVWVFNPPNDGTGTAQIYLDGAQVKSDTWQYQFNTTDSYFLGANQVANAGFAGQMFELLCYKGAHNAAVRTFLLNYGRNKWGF